MVTATVHSFAEARARRGLAPWPTPPPLRVGDKALDTATGYIAVVIAAGHPWPREAVLIALPGRQCLRHIDDLAALDSVMP